jgi:hypothetical protein
VPRLGGLPYRVKKYIETVSFVIILDRICCTGKKHRMEFRPRNTVDRVGAKTGAILRGAARHNKGLRLRVLQEQARGRDGAIQGAFEILDAGDNKHSSVLEALMGAPTDAAEVLRVIRQENAGCVSVVNSNILTVEPENGSA